MAQYLLLLRNDGEQQVDALPEADRQELLNRFMSWTEELQRRGKLRAVEQLLDPAGGRVVRRRMGQLAVDGPYAEAKEAVMGLFIIEAADQSQAVEIAKETPFLDFGGMVEVRELGSFPRPSER